MGPFIPNNRPLAEPNRNNQRQEIYEQLIRQLNEAEARWTRRSQPVEHHYDGMRRGRMYCTCGWRTHHWLFRGGRRLIRETEEHERLMAFMEGH